jgi:hypothetical protein
MCRIPVQKERLAKERQKPVCEKEDNDDHEYPYKMDDVVSLRAESSSLMGDACNKRFGLAVEGVEKIQTNLAIKTLLRV